MQYQHKLAAQAVGLLAEPGRKVLRLDRGDLLELFGQFAPDGDGAPAQRGQRQGGRHNAMRRLQQHHAARLGRQRLHRQRALGGPGAQKAGEDEPRSGVAIRHDARHAQGGGDAARARQRHNFQPA